MIFIMMNTLSLALFHDGQNMEWIRAYGVLEVVFTSIFTAGNAALCTSGVAVASFVEDYLQSPLRS